MGSRQERKERITEYRQKQILDAALAVFSRKGYGEATIPDIAGEAGIAVGTIYNYYESKRDLLVSIVQTYVLTDTFKKLLEQSGGSKVDERTFITSVIENRLNFGFENVDRFLFILLEILRDPELRQQFSEKVIGPVFKFPEKYLKAKITSGDFRPVNHRVIIRAVVGMVIGMILLRRVEAENSPCQGVSTRELAAQLADLVLTGLQAKGS